MSRIKNLKHSFREVTQNIADAVDTHFKGFDVVALGPSYSTMPYTEVDENLRKFRATKKWEIPSATQTNDRRVKSINEMLASDAEGMTVFSKQGCDEFTRSQLNLMRFRLRKNLERHYRFNPERLRMPKGETVVSAKGDVSLVAKLRDLKQWCCTEDAFEKAALVIYKTPALKACARNHFPLYTQKESMRLNDAFSECVDRGFEVFKCKLLDIVTFVDGMRLETVPKDNEKDRVIGCEPLLNMIAQSVIEEGIRHVIDTIYGIDLDTSQSLHHLLIADLDNVTIDFKNASNSSFMCFLDWCLKGTDLHEHMTSCRSPGAMFDGSFIPLNMVSPMGNGFTFGYMTMIILAISREYDSFAHVFGDDLIIDKHASTGCLEALSAIGYEVNVTKSFIAGDFRESCGAFWSLDHYITSFEMEYPVDIVSAIILTNKIGILGQKCGGHWVQLHTALLDMIPAYLYKWQPSIDAQICELQEQPFGQIRQAKVGKPTSYAIESASAVVYSNTHMRRKRTCAISRQLWQTKTAESDDWLNKHQYSPTEVSLVMHVEYMQDTYRNVPLENVTPFWYAYYMWSGRCSAPTRRVSLLKRKIRATATLISYWSHSFDASCNTRT